MVDVKRPSSTNIYRCEFLAFQFPSFFFVECIRGVILNYQLTSRIMSITSATYTGLTPVSQHTKDNLTFYPYVLHSIFGSQFTAATVAPNIPMETIKLNTEVGPVGLHARLKDEDEELVETAHESDGGGKAAARTAGNWYLKPDQKNKTNVHLTADTRDSYKVSSSPPTNNPNAPLSHMKSSKSPQGGILPPKNAAKRLVDKAKERLHRLHDFPTVLSRSGITGQFTPLIVEVTPNKNQYFREVPCFGLFSTQYIASKFIPQGQTILVEQPLITISDFFKNSEEVIQNYYDQADKALKQRFDKMLNLHPEEGFYGTLLTNAVKLKETGDRAMIFEKALRFRRSCDANITIVCHGGGPAAYCIALTDIRPGTELLQRYFPSHASPFQIRQAQILEEYNIICQCRLCTLPLIERERSDDSRVRRREILDNLDRDMKRNPTLALARIEEAILLAVQEGLWEGIFWDFEKACMICCGWGDEESAEMWREPAKRAATLTWGDQISKILSSTVIDVEPKKTKIWDTFRIAAKTGKTQLKGPDPAFLRQTLRIFAFINPRTGKMDPLFDVSDIEDMGAAITITGPGTSIHQPQKEDMTNEKNDPNILLQAPPNSSPTSLITGSVNPSSPMSLFSPGNLSPNKMNYRRKSMGIMRKKLNF
ncbi:hypothetical protein C345_06373 [Cryptococcus neoformans A2-102-5]|nr:hypothetical protein C350_06130 [Cryptococcus neoformans var. grubii MW-RSA36]OXG78093.1 hypothetical protein C346_06170 [Cryptococcus neoformans var. grubii D17-1]OXG91750.1 hypothetical protein C345_06373 [Cryptococcus neoformans var. grubii A2-102-5]OXL09542.1 hypothetical protein C348_01925 [Cryptococcus neoformans var. grubii Gb118]